MQRINKNAEILKTSTIETAKASERGIVDVETLKVTNESLISTLDEILAFFSIIVAHLLTGPTRELTRTLLSKMIHLITAYLLIK